MLNRAVIMGFVFGFLLKTTVLWGVTGLPSVICVRLKPDQSVSRTLHLQSEAKSIKFRLFPFTLSPTGSVLVDALQVYRGRNFRIPFHIDQPYPWAKYYPVTYQVSGPKSPIPFEQLILELTEELPTVHQWEAVEEYVPPQCQVYIINSVCEKFLFEIQAADYNRRSGVLVLDLLNQSNVPVNPSLLVTIYQKKPVYMVFSKKVHVMDFPITELKWLYPGREWQIKIPAVLLPGKYMVSVQVRARPPFEPGMLAVITSDLVVE